MAQYKVPQDVEADDKLIGPFSFRQFVYLMIAGGLVALAVGLFQLFPVLAIIPLPPVLLLVALALPLKKDQPMETYLAALVSYYMKPRTRVWRSGQRESTINITAPKKIEQPRTRDITGEEATHRLSFLADIVDTEGYAIKGVSSKPMREDLVAEAEMAEDIFEGARFDSLGTVIQKDEIERHAEVVRQMQETIDETHNLAHTETVKKMQATFDQDQNEISSAKIHKNSDPEPIEKAAPTTPQPTTEPALTSAPALAQAPKPSPKATRLSPVVVLPEVEPVENSVEKSTLASTKSTKKASPKPVKPSIIELANNDVFSVATIADQAKRINRKRSLSHCIKL